MKSFIHRAVLGSYHWLILTHRFDRLAISKLRFRLGLAISSRLAFTLHSQLHVCSWNSRWKFSGSYSCGPPSAPLIQQLCFQSPRLLNQILVSEQIYLSNSRRLYPRTKPFIPAWLASALGLRSRVYWYLHGVERLFSQLPLFCLLMHLNSRFEHC